MKKLLYLAGPISANPTAREGFDAAVSALENAGYAVKNPFMISPSQYFEGYEQMTLREQDLAQLKADLIVMLGCDGVATMPLSHSSRGTARELALAFSLEMIVRPVGEWLRESMIERRKGDEYGQDS